MNVFIIKLIKYLQLQFYINIIIFIVYWTKQFSTINYMAFVVDKSQKKSIFQPSKQLVLAPGPGSYILPFNNQKNNEYCAPFNTSQVKISTFEVQQTKYGPGYYQPKYYKDINKTNSNNGYVFASKIQRFDIQNKKSPKQQRTNNNLLNQTSLMNKTKSEINNTTNYQSNPPDKNYNKDFYYKKLEKSKSVMQQIRSQNQKNKVESIKGKRQFIRVLLTSSNNTQNIQSRYIYRNLRGKGLGPGSYQNIQFSPKKKGISKWNLQKNDRFKTTQNQVPGPGSYQNNSMLRSSSSQKNFNSQHIFRPKDKRLSASFASTVIRSHMDTIIYKTNIPIKAAILQDKRLKDFHPGPGSYNTIQSHKDKKSFNYGCETSFGYCCRSNIELLNQKPGPGQYNFDTGTITSKIKDKNFKNALIKDIRNQIFGKKGKIANNDNKNNCLARAIQNKLSPDPNFINPNSQIQRKQKRMAKFCSLQQRCFSKLGNMSQQQRFKNENNKGDVQPGPGQYYNTSFSFKNIQTQKAETSIFKSRTGRKVFNNNPQQQIPFYNIIRNDIGFKAQKMKRYIQNLKKINIQKTPFHTSSKRFIQHKNQDQLNIIIQQHQQKNRKLISDHIIKQPSCAFKSGTKRQIFKSQQKPGPGDYQLKMKNNGGYQSLQKKSFNKYYGLSLQIQQQKQADKNSLNKSVQRKNSKKKQKETKQNGNQTLKGKKINQIDQANDFH